MANKTFLGHFYVIHIFVIFLWWKLWYMLSMIVNPDAQLIWKIMKSWNWTGIEHVTYGYLAHWSTTELQVTVRQVNHLMYCKYIENIFKMINQLFLQHKTKIFPYIDQWDTYYIVIQCGSEWVSLWEIKVTCGECVVSLAILFSSTISGSCHPYPASGTPEQKRWLILWCTRLLLAL